ncbi:MAG: Gfo/Idh/MocA family oxidoreductase [Lachnospiraceae bacterium]|jgi:predicted dehydrogenase|nr:Gfo/Idh/MocA family oxidoreductase [Lachnospiraceae bacterium]
MKFAILAPGKIANSMAKAISGIEKIERYAVASRDQERADIFAKKWGFEKAYGSYEAMVEDPQVEFVYVASPHSHHYEHAKLCLEHGKHVLVEKAFTVNAQQAEELIRLSREKHLLLAEAIWTRYMPSRNMIDEILASGVLGKVTSLTANLGYILPHVERMQNPELAGGALLDLGVYPINFALMAFQGEVKEVHAAAVMSPKGVDWVNSMTFIFEDGKMAVLHSDMLAQTDRQGVISGDKGYLEVQNINNCEEIRVFDLDRKMTACYQVPEQINGYEYEALSCIKAIEEGKVECPEMPHSETLRVMKLLDGIRRQWGMVFPCEES